jgi:hypothetical protein
MAGGEGMLAQIRRTSRRYMMETEKIGLHLQTIVTITPEKVVAWEKN